MAYKFKSVILSPIKKDMLEYDKNNKKLKLALNNQLKALEKCNN